MDEPPLPSAAPDFVDLPGSRVTSAAEGLPRRRFTVAEVEAIVEAGIMQDDERVELIGGELVPMSAKGNRHETVKIALVRMWCRAAPDDVEVAQETTFRLSVDTYLEPDVVLFDRKGLSSLSGESVFLVLEIADSSLRFDIGRKAAIYASFGVRELWVIDAVKMRTRVFYGPGPSGYAETFEVVGDEPVTPLFAPEAFTLRLSELDV